MSDFVNDLNLVRLFTPADALFFTVDNRPLVDMSITVSTLNTIADNISGIVNLQTLQDSSSVANTILVTATQSLFPGVLLNVRVANSNTGPVSLVYTGQVADVGIPVLSNGNPLQGGEMVAGNWYLLVSDGVTVSILSGTAGTSSSLPASGFQQAVPLGQFEDSSISPNLVSVTTGSLEVSGPASVVFPFTATTNSDSSGSVVTLGSLQQGISAQAALVPWTGLTSDQPLAIGQTALYEVQGQNLVQLHVSCEENQLYEVTVLELSTTSGTGDANLILLANNTGYASAFYSGGLETSLTNQGQFYTPASSTASSGLALSQQGNAQPRGQGFWFGSVKGGTSTPFLRILSVFTGNSQTQPMVMQLGGGGSPFQGVNMSMSSWDNGSTSYTSLGTLYVSTSFDGMPSLNWKVLVRRIA